VSGKQTSMAAFVKSDTVAVKMTAIMFKLGIVKFAMQHFVPFRFFSSEVFKSLNGEMAEKLKEIKYFFYYINF